MSNRRFIMTEDQVQKLKQTVEMTPDTFNSNIRHFLHSLMSDPVNTQPTQGLKANGLTRGQLLYYLKKFGIIERRDRLSDKDKNGNPKTATMKTSFIIKGKIDDEEEYRVPKNNFDRKVEKMRRYIFEKNLPEPVHRKKEGEDSNEAYPNPLMYPTTELSEDGGGACAGGATSSASSGAFVTKLGEEPISQRGAFRQTVFTEDVIKRIDRLLDEYDCDCLGSKIKFKATNGKEYTSKLSYITGDDTVYHVVDTDNGYMIFKKDPDSDTAEMIKGSENERTELNEANMSALYHFCGPNSLIRMMQTGKFELNDHESDWNDGYKYYLSTTRNRNSQQGYPYMNSDYGMGGTMNNEACQYIICRVNLNVDGLRKYGKFKPFDYLYHETEEDWDNYGYERLNGKQDSIYSDDERENQHQPFSQAEERLFSNHKEIPFNQNTVLGIDVYIDEAVYDVETEHEQYEKEMAKKLESMDGINIYHDRGRFDLQKGDLEETTTFDAGDYTFVAPPFKKGKKKKDPVYQRHDAVGGSHSVEIVKENIDNGEFKFNLDSIPLEVLRKGYRDLRLTPRFRDFEEESGINEYLKEVINEILPPDEVSSKIQSKYNLPDQFISVQEGYHGIKIYILVATIGENDDVITKDMHEMGYYLESSQFIGEVNGMKFHQMQFLPYSQNQEDVTDIVKNKCNVLYHWSPSENTEKILTDGLIPRHRNDVSLYPDRIYLIYGNTNQDRIDGLARQLSMANKHQQNKGNYTLFSIDVKNLPENVRLYNDPMCPIGLYCEEPIPAELVKLVKQEQLKEHIQYISESSIQAINEKHKKEDFFEKHGIKVQKIDQTHQVCSIGFSEKEQKWYGWSHRAIYGFGIGSKVKKGDAGYDEHGSEWTAKTLDDAKQMAIDFANSVS